jgi:hypothetical protein
VVWLSRFTTRFGSLDDYEKGHVEVIDDEPHHYAFSNVFETASRSRPYEKVAVGKNRQYVLEAIRAEGTSDWRTCAHDEFALVMDGEPGGPPMGEITASRGHMTLLPSGAAYRFHADRPGVILMQTIEGPDTVFKWAEIVQTTP